MQQYSIPFEHDGASIDLTYYELVGKYPGKHLIISGGMHGDEINGVMMVRRMIDFFTSSTIADRLYGKITLIPVLNPLGFEQMSRRVPLDNKDLNRCFGLKSKNLSRSVMYARFLSEKFFTWADHVIDIHDSGGRYALTPHPRIHACRENQCFLITRQMATWFGSKITLEREWHSRMLAVYANNHRNTVVMTLELGGDQHCFIHWYDSTRDGIINIMRGLDYLDEEVIDCACRQHFLTERNTFRAPCTGILKHYVWLSDAVVAGQLLAEVYDPILDTTCPIYAVDDGFIFSQWQPDMIGKGRHIMSVIA